MLEARTALKARASTRLRNGMNMAVEGLVGEASTIFQPRYVLSQPQRQRIILCGDMKSMHCRHPNVVVAGVPIGYCRGYLCAQLAMGEC